MKRSLQTPRRGAAVILVLLLVVLLTVLVVTYSSVVLNETRMSSQSEGSHRVESYTRLALDDAMGSIRTALAPFDAPFGTTTPPTRFWALAPGRILHYPLARSATPRPAPVETFDLHSGAPFDENKDPLDAALVVDLNAPTASGHRPIDDSLPANQKMAVRWKPILADPSNPTAGENNRLVGRYAFWIDDEGAKININTADGRHKYDFAKSDGPGSVTEVDLGILDDPAPLSTQERDAIAERVRSGGFTAAGEIQQIPGVPAEFHTRNQFLLTTYSRSPEFNLFNEPRLQLVPTNLKDTQGNANSTDANDIFGSLWTVRNITANLLSLAPLRSVYPTPRQESLASVYPVMPNVNSGNGFHNTNLATLVKASKTSDPVAAGWAKVSAAYAQMAETIANYLDGTNARKVSVAWPFEQTAYSQKYNLRQVDSITLQLMDLAKTSINKGASLDCTKSDPSTDNPAGTFALFGILQDEPVVGFARAPRINEIFFQLTPAQVFNSDGDPKAMTVKTDLRVELFFPTGSFHPPYAYSDGYQANGTQYFFGTFNVNTGPSIINSADAPVKLAVNKDANGNDTSTISARYPPVPGAGNGSPLGGNSFWMDNILIARDQNGDPAGIDFWGNALNLADPDQVKAALYREPPATGPYMGRGPDKDYCRPVFVMNGLGGISGYKRFRAGQYLVARSYPGMRGWGYATRDPVNGMEPVTSLTISGGISILHPFFGVVSRGMQDFTPIESLHGPAQIDGRNSNIAGRFDSGPFQPDQMIPIPTLHLSPGVPAYFHAYVLDPYVNKNIGDWIIRTDNQKVTMDLDAKSETGAPNEGAIDLAASWVGRDYYVPPSPMTGGYRDWSRQASFPSVGILHYIRTKMMPDTGDNKGVPFRCLSFAPADDPTQSGLPDWAMLDLFTVPQGFWRPSVTPFAPGTRDYSFTDFFGGDYRNLTYGGATSGRINVNGSVLYPWADSDDTRLPARLKPLEAVFVGLKYNLDGKFSIEDDGTVTSLAGPITPEQSETIASGIADWITSNGPLILPGQICDVPAVNAYNATVNATRNDVVAQSYGELTTQGNVFSIWLVTEAIQKARSNQQHGELENGDEIISTRRMHFIVERYLDLGADQVPGNVANPGTDKVVGTMDDVVDAVNHPMDPKFKYRIIYAEEVR